MVPPLGMALDPALALALAVALALALALSLAFLWPHLYYPRPYSYP